MTESGALGSAFLRWVKPTNGPCSVLHCAQTGVSADKASSHEVSSHSRVSVLTSPYKVDRSMTARTNRVGLLGCGSAGSGSEIAGIFRSLPWPSGTLMTSYVAITQAPTARPRAAVWSTFGGAEGFGNRGANGGAIASIGVSWTVINCLFSYNAAVGNGASDGNGGNRDDTPINVTNSTIEWIAVLGAKP